MDAQLGPRWHRSGGKSRLASVIKGKQAGDIVDISKFYRAAYNSTLAANDTELQGFARDLNANAGTPVEHINSVSVGVAAELQRTLKIANDSDAPRFMQKQARGALAEGVGLTFIPIGIATRGKALAQGAARARYVPKGVDKSWKNVIEGKAQKTGTPGHQFRSYREAIKMAKSGQYEKVRLNRAYSTTTGVKTSPRRLPDVIGRRTDGRIDSVEVPSRTDNPAFLYQRNVDAMQQLPASMRGNVRIAPIQ